MATCALRVRTNTDMHFVCHAQKIRTALLCDGVEVGEGVTEQEVLRLAAECMSAPKASNRVRGCLQIPLCSGLC